MKRNYRSFAAEMNDLSGIEQRLVETVTFAKWLRTHLHRNFNLIVTRHIDRVASEFMAATGRRLYVRQIAHGIYRQISDDHGQPRALGLLLAAAITGFASVWLVTLSLSLAASAPVAISGFFPAVVLVCLLVYAYVWLHVGVQAVQRIQSRSA